MRSRSAAMTRACLRDACAADPPVEKHKLAVDRKGRAKPGGFPYTDRAPTGRAKCMQCEEPIAKDSFRVAVEREIDTGYAVEHEASGLAANAHSRVHPPPERLNFFHRAVERGLF